MRGFSSPLLWFCEVQDKTQSKIWSIFFKKKIKSYQLLCVSVLIVI